MLNPELVIGGARMDEKKGVPKSSPAFVSDSTQKAQTAITNAPPAIEKNNESPEARNSGDNANKLAQRLRPDSTAPKADEKKKIAKKRLSRKVPENTECQNCGATLEGEYCHQCGQAAREPRRLVIGLVQDVFVDTLAIDGKLARSILLLLWRPGILARRFLDGKRVHYSPPFRLYLFASVFFFFAAFWMINLSSSLPNEIGGTVDPVMVDSAQKDVEDAQKEIEAALGASTPDTIVDDKEDLEETLNDTFSENPSDFNTEADENSDGISIEEGDANELRRFQETPWADTNYNGPTWLEPHAQRLYEAAQRVVDDPRLFASETRANVPRFLLLAPVIYGLTLSLLYFYRRKIFIYDHFIVSLYMHAALYAYLLLAILISHIPTVGGWLWIVPVGWGAAQPFFVLRQAYNSNWLSVWIKWLISNFIYVVSFALIITLGLSYSLYQS